MFSLVLYTLNNNNVYNKQNHIKCTEFNKNTVFCKSHIDINSQNTGNYCQQQIRQNRTVNPETLQKIFQRPCDT